MKSLKKKKGISLIVLIITIIVMIILAAAIILSISNSGIMDKANKAKKDSDTANLKEYVNVLQAEWELMSENERTGTIKSYIETQIDNKGISLDGYYITETGEIITDSIIAYVEYLKEQKGPMENWDDITVTDDAYGWIYTDKGFEFEYAGVNYMYIYAKCSLYDDDHFIFGTQVIGLLDRDNIVVEIPEGATWNVGGGFYNKYVAVIFPKSLTVFDPGLFYAYPQNLKEIKINGTLTSITGCGIEETDCDFPDTCRIFYQDEEMTVSEFTKLFE